MWVARLEYMHILFFIISEKLEVLSELVNPINASPTHLYNETQACHPMMESLKNFSSYLYMYQSRPLLIYAAQMDSCTVLCQLVSPDEFVHL